MKVFVIICIGLHITNAIVPPFTDILSGGVGSLLSGLNPLGPTAETDSDQAQTAGGLASRFGGFLGGPRQIAGDVLGVKVNLLTALRNTITGDGEIPLEGTDGAVDGTGVGVSGFETSGASSASQTFSANSGFASMSVGEESGSSALGLSAGSSAGGYSNSQNYQPPATSYGTPNIESGSGYAANGGGYNYNRPSSGYAPSVQNTYGPPSTGSGYAANGGYNYNRPNSGYAPSVQNTYGPPNNDYASQGFASSQSSFSSNAQTSSSAASDTTFNAESSSSGDISISQVGGGASDFSSGSSSTIQATQSGTGALSGSSATSSRRSQGGIQGFANSLITSGVQLPINLLNSYRSGVNRGFDTVASGIDTLQRIFGGLGGSSDASSDSDSDDQPPSSFNLDSSNDLRRLRRRFYQL